MSGAARSGLRAGALAAALVLLACDAPSGAGEAPVPDAVAEERFSGLVFRVPAGFSLVAETEDAVPSPIPDAPASIERFRRYEAGPGVALHVFHLGPRPGDRGPMAWAETWEVPVAGRTVTAGRTRLFFGTEQAVLAAHLGHPAPGFGAYLVYATGLERPAFDAWLRAVRYEDADGVSVSAVRAPPAAVASSGPPDHAPVLVLAGLMRELDGWPGAQDASRVAIAKMMVDPDLLARIGRGERVWVLLFDFPDEASSLPTLQAIGDAPSAAGLYFSERPAGLRVVREVEHGPLRALVVRGGWTPPVGR